MVVLQNASLTVTIDPLGAELTSVRKDQAEYLWQGDPRWWAGRAPVLFPICGGLKNDQYTWQGKSYTLEKHGFASRKRFAVEAQTAERATFLLRDDEETRRSYPFAFALRVTYTLCGDALEVRYAVSGPADAPLYFSIGAHEAYACPEGVSAYEIVFEQPETLRSTVVTGPLLAHESVAVPTDGAVLALRDAYFTVDALVFEQLRSRSLTLRHRATGRGVRVDYPGFDALLLWTKPGAPFLCVEPWCGLPDYVDADGPLCGKPRILRAEPGQTVEKLHRFTLL